MSKVILGDKEESHRKRKGASAAGPHQNHAREQFLTLSLVTETETFCFPLSRFSECLSLDIRCPLSRSRGSSGEACSLLFSHSPYSEHGEEYKQKSRNESSFHSSKFPPLHIPLWESARKCSRQGTLSANVFPSLMNRVALVCAAICA